MIRHPSASHCPGHRVHPFRTTQLSGQKPTTSDHQPDCCELGPLAAMVCSCFYPDGVTVGLNSDHSPCGWIVSSPSSVYQASVGTSPLPPYRYWDRAGAPRGPPSSTGPRGTTFLETVDWWAGCSSAPNRQVAQSRQSSEPWQRWVAGTHPHPTLHRQEVLSIMRCSLERSSIRRRTVPAAQSCCSLGCNGLLPLPEQEQKSLGHCPLLLSLPRCPTCTFQGHRHF